MSYKIKIFLDCADIIHIKQHAGNEIIKGFTTNPTLMYQAGIKNYQEFAQAALQAVGGKPISFEVFSDSLDEMLREARIIGGWSKNIYIKIPICNSEGTSTAPVIKTLLEEGFKINITAVMTPQQIEQIAAISDNNSTLIISIFAGRIADTGVDPIPFVTKTVEAFIKLPKVEILWASTREIFNLFQAEKVGCQIITLPQGLFDKLKLYGKDLNEYSKETSAMFNKAAIKAGFKL